MLRLSDESRRLWAGDDDRARARSGACVARRAPRARRPRIPRHKTWARCVPPYVTGIAFGHTRGQYCQYQISLVNVLSSSPVPAETRDHACAPISLHTCESFRSSHRDAAPAVRPVRRARAQPWSPSNWHLRLVDSLARERVLEDWFAALHRRNVARNLLKDVQARARVLVAIEEALAHHLD